MFVQAAQDTVFVGFCRYGVLISCSGSPKLRVPIGRNFMFRLAETKRKAYRLSRTAHHERDRNAAVWLAKAYIHQQFPYRGTNAFGVVISCNLGGAASKKCSPVPDRFASFTPPSFSAARTSCQLPSTSGRISALAGPICVAAQTQF